MVERGMWSKADEEALLERCGREIDAAVEAYLARAPAPATDMFDFVHAARPAALEAQRRLVQKAGAR
jgi:TPP-dependent pyruvate/acetoin dehydrogenase alpha subunit